MVIPPVTTVPTKPSPKRRRNPNPRPRPPIPVGPSRMTELPISALPPQLHALLKSLPEGHGLPVELLGSMVVQRTPLANATLSLWSFVLKPAALDEIFQKYRGRSFEDILKFSTFVELIRDALILHKGSGRASFQRAKEQGTLPTCQEAVYGKLGRVPIPLSLGFFEDVSQMLREILPQGKPVTAIPASL